MHLPPLPRLFRVALGCALLGSLISSAMAERYSFQQDKQFCCYDEVTAFRDGVLLTGAQIAYLRFPEMVPQDLATGSMTDWLLTHDEAVYSSHTGPPYAVTLNRVGGNPLAATLLHSFEGQEILLPKTLSGALFPVKFLVTGYGGPQVWKSDGTPDGTAKVTDLPDTITVEHMSYGAFQVNGNLFWFQENQAYDVQLWRSDGTADGTTSLKTIDTESRLSRASEIPGGVVVFHMRTDAGRTEVWRTDGTTAGTFVLLQGDNESTPTGSAFIEQVPGGVFLYKSLCAGDTCTYNRYLSNGSVEGTLPFTIPGWDTSTLDILAVNDGHVFVQQQDPESQQTLFLLVDVETGLSVNIFGPRTVDALSVNPISSDAGLRFALFGTVAKWIGGRWTYPQSLDILGATFEEDSAESLLCSTSGLENAYSPGGLLAVDGGIMGFINSGTVGVFSGQSELCPFEETGEYAADVDHDSTLSLSEVLRVVQFYNSGRYHCAPPEEESEDGYNPGFGDILQTCAWHDSDLNFDYVISLSELLRVIQLYNIGGFRYCPREYTEDNYCPEALAAD